MDLLFKVSRMNVKSLILIIEWIGYSFAKHVISHCFIMVTYYLERLNVDPCVLEMYYGKCVVGLDVD
jgi:hypothetical protein